MIDESAVARSFDPPHRCVDVYVHLPFFHTRVFTYCRHSFAFKACTCARTCIRTAWVCNSCAIDSLVNKRTRLYLLVTSSMQYVLHSPCSQSTEPLIYTAARKNPTGRINLVRYLAGSQWRLFVELALPTSIDKVVTVACGMQAQLEATIFFAVQPLTHFVEFVWHII